MVAAINVEMLRYERKMRRAHQMLAHLRTECYPVYSQSVLGRSFWPAHSADLTVTDQELRIDEAKRRVGYLRKMEPVPTLNIQDLLDRSSNERQE